MKKTFKEWMHENGPEVPASKVIIELMSRAPCPKRDEILAELIDSMLDDTKFIPSGVWDDEYYDF